MIDESKKMQDELTTEINFMDKRNRELMNTIKDLEKEKLMMIKKIQELNLKNKDILANKEEINVIKLQKLSLNLSHSSLDFILATLKPNLPKITLSTSNKDS